MNNTDSGFTLIEVLIALSIIAISLIASVKSSSEVTRNLNYIQDKTNAHFVANNVMTEILSGQSGYYLSSGSRQGVMLFDGRNWYWQLQIDLASSDMLKVSVGVSEEEGAPLMTQLDTYVFNNRK